MWPLRACSTPWVGVITAPLSVSQSLPVNMSLVSQGLPVNMSPRLVSQGLPVNMSPRVAGSAGQHVTAVGFRQWGLVGW